MSAPRPSSRTPISFVSSRTARSDPFTAALSVVAMGTERRTGAARFGMTLCPTNHGSNTFFPLFFFPLLLAGSDGNNVLIFPFKLPQINCSLLFLKLFLIRNLHL